MAGGAGRIGRGVAGRVYRGGAGRIYRASRISGNMPCRASERGFSDPDIARSTGKDGTAQASYRKIGHRSISMAGFTDSGLRGGFCHSAGATLMANPPPRAIFILRDVLDVTFLVVIL